MYSSNSRTLALQVTSCPLLQTWFEQLLCSVAAPAFNDADELHGLSSQLQLLLQQGACRLLAQSPVYQTLSICVCATLHDAAATGCMQAATTKLQLPTVLPIMFLQRCMLPLQASC
jgi:hypothetical protein